MNESDLGERIRLIREQITLKREDLIPKLREHASEHFASDHTRWELSGTLLLLNNLDVVLRMVLGETNEVIVKYYYHGTKKIDLEILKDQPALEAAEKDIIRLWSRFGLHSIPIEDDEIVREWLNDV